MASNRHKRAIGGFSRLQNAQQAHQALKDSGLAIEQVSLIAKDSNGAQQLHPAMKPGGGNKAVLARSGVIAGGSLGSLGGLLVGLGAVTIPGIGVATMGTAGSAAPVALAGGCLGVATGALFGAIIGAGIPKDRAQVNSEPQRGYWVSVDGTDEEIRRAESICRDRGVQEWEVYNS